MGIWMCAFMFYLKYKEKWNMGTKHTFGYTLGLHCYGNFRRYNLHYIVAECFSQLCHTALGKTELINKEPGCFTQGISK